MRLFLASASPRRQLLLAELGVSFEIVPSAVDEILPSGRSARAAATTLALAKARAVAIRVSAATGDRAVIVGADTLVVVDGRALGKPSSPGEARKMLTTLRGRAHQVITGVAVLEWPAGREVVEAVTSRVLMREYSQAEVEAYVLSDEPYDKAGAYAVQGAGSRLVAAVEGCYTNVVGLPLRTTARLLRAFGVSVADPPAVTAGEVSGPAEPAPP